MTDPSAGDGSVGAPGALDLEDPAQLEVAVREVALRLLAGGVSRATISQLQRMMRENVGDYPWQEVTRRILAEDVDAQTLVQRGLTAQRDWIWRGGRETPGPSLSHRTKGFFAKLVAQTIFLLIWAVVLVAGLLLLKHLTGIEIYAALDWLYSLFPSLQPR